jgi:hypothetical protein
VTGFHQWQAEEGCRTSRVGNQAGHPQGSIESKLEMDKSELKKDFLEFVGYLKKMDIIHDEHCHVVEHKKTGDSGMKNSGKGSDAGSHSSGHNS